MKIEKMNKGSKIMGFFYIDRDIYKLVMREYVTVLHTCLIAPAIRMRAYDSVRGEDYEHQQD